MGGGPVGACCALELARGGADVVLLEREAEVCPAVSGAYANCGLLVPSDATPLAAPGVLGQGLRWMLDASSPFYIAPRPSPALVRWLWLFRAACSEERAQAAAPVLRALHVTERASPRRARRRARRPLALPPRRRAAGLRDGRRPRSRGRRGGAGTRARRSRRRGHSGGGARHVPQPPLRARRRVLLPGGRSPRPDALHAGGRRAGRAGRSDDRERRRGPGPGAGGERGARRDHTRRVRRRPGRAGRGRLDPTPDAQPRAAPADRARQGLQRRRGPACRTSRICRCTSATPTS